MLRRLLKAACLACSLGAADATVQAQELGRVDISLPRISYRLEDLAPDDGIAPSIQFDASANIRGYIYGDGFFSLEGGGPFSTGTEEIVSSNGLSRATFSAQAIHISSSIDEAALRSLHPNKHLNTGFTVSAGSDGWNFTLSPHTAIVMEGQVSWHTEVDLSSLAESDLVSGPLRKFDLIAANARYHVSIHLEKPWSLDQQYFFVEFGTFGELTKDGWSSNFHPDGLEDFSLRLENNSDLAERRRIMLDVLAVTSAFGYPPVPEPGAWALALAGAVVIGGCAHVRRRRGAQKVAVKDRQHGNDASVQLVLNQGH